MYEIYVCDRCGREVAYADFKYNESECCGETVSIETDWFGEYDDEPIWEY